MILNENMKIYRRPRTWIMIAAMIAIVVLASWMDYYYDSKEAKTSTWQTQVTEQRLEFESNLKKGNMEPDNRQWMQDQVAIIDYRLAHDIQPTDGTMWDSILNAASLVILITLFTVIVAGDSLAGEFSGGTIKLLLIRPNSRLKILVSKYLSMILFGLLLLVILFVVSFLFNGLLYGFGNMDLPYVDVNAAGEVFEKSMMANLWQLYLLNGVSTIIFVTMAFMISSAFRSSAMAIGFSIFLLFAGAFLTEVLHRFDWSRYMLFANIDLSQYLSGRPYLEGMTLSFSITVLIAYYVLFNLVSWLVFTRRDVAS